MSAPCLKIWDKGATSPFCAASMSERLVDDMAEIFMVEKSLEKCQIKISVFLLCTGQGCAKLTDFEWIFGFGCDFFFSKFSVLMPVLNALYPIRNFRLRFWLGIYYFNHFGYDFELTITILILWVVISKEFCFFDMFGCDFE